MNDAPAVRRTFSSVTLRTGLRRVVSAWAGGADVPTVMIGLYDGEARLMRTKFGLGAELDVLEATVAATDDPDLEGSRLVGELRHGPHIVLGLCAHRHRNGHDVGVSFSKWLRSGGKLGGVTSLTGAEVSSIAHAIQWVRHMAEELAHARTEEP